MAEVTMKYLGSPLNLTNDIFPSNKLAEIQIIQQHCGASTICVFRELLPANSKTCLFIVPLNVFYSNLNDPHFTETNNI